MRQRSDEARHGFVATPKSQAKEPIAFDIVLVCRKQTAAQARRVPSVADALGSARSKIDRLLAAGFTLSRNDRRIVLYGQLLGTLSSACDAAALATVVDAELANERAAPRVPRRCPEQQLLFGDVGGFQ